MGEEKTRGPVIVRNRDILVLADISSVMQLVESTERRLEWQHDRMLSIRQHISGMPGGGGLPKGLDDAFAKLAEVGEEYETQLRAYLRQIREAQKILNGIESRSMLAFVTLKYVKHASNAEVMRRMKMTEWGFNRGRRSIEEAQDMQHVKWRERYILGEREKNL